MHNYRIIFTANFDAFFLSHRLPIALEAQKSGYDIVVICENTGTAHLIIEHGFKYIELPFKREKRLNLFREVYCICFLYKQYKMLKPDLIHHISIKPVIYGSLVTRFMHNRIAIVNAFSGMGYLFTDSRKKFSEFFLIPLFRFIFKQNRLKIILQNQDDLNLFLEKKIVNVSQLELIKGSGVDLNKFAFSPIPELNNNSMRIILHARMLRDKGVFEFYEAARLIKKEFPQTQFTLCGDIDKANPTSLTKEQLEQWTREGIVTWIGHQKKIREIIASHHLVVLPSYREGLPKSLIEACAIGRPIITTDTNGCRECVIPGYNGFLVPVKDSLKLAEAIKMIIQNQNLLTEFGANSRLLAEKEFDIASVLVKTLTIYKELLKQNKIKFTVFT
jgi:glycosyltransferase involved in cell wall biosynthesis